MQLRISLLGLIFLISVGVTAQQKTYLHVIDTFHIASSGKWDFIAISPVKDWLYVSHGTQVNVLNKITGDSAGVISNTIGVHGIAFDKNAGKGFISNGKSNTLTVFDINTNKVLDEIATTTDPDAIFYETFSRKIIVSHGHTKYIGIIDPVTDKETDSIDVGGSPEVAVSDGAGKLFVNIEDKSEIVVVDMKTFKVLHHWSLAPGEGPTGLSIDTKTKRLFAGCEKMLIIVNADNGTIVNEIPIGEGCDGTAFDAITKNIYASCGAGVLTVMHEVTANKFTIAETVVTKKGARTLALDNSTHNIYLPTAEFEPLQSGDMRKPQMKPGTFQVLVVGK